MDVNSHDAGIEAVQQHFETTDGSGRGLPFKDPDQKWILYSISHEKVPPLAPDASSPGIRFYGCFKNEKMAKHYAEKIIAVDTGTSLFMGKSHAWILAPRSIVNYQDADYVTKKTETLLKRSKIECDVQTARFKQHQDELKSKALSEEDAKEMVEPEEEKGEEDKEEKNEVEEEEDEEDDGRPMLTTECIPANQVNMICSFINDEKKNADSPEFLFYCYRSCRDDDESDGFIKNVASKQVTEHDIFNVCNGEWLFPIRDHKTCKKIYRDKRLNEIMNRKSVNEQMQVELESANKV